MNQFLGSLIKYGLIVAIIGISMWIGMAADSSNKNELKYGLIKMSTLLEKK